MSLNNLQKITKRGKKRLGQGHGSGKVKTAGRGTKGQKARGNIPVRAPDMGGVANFIFCDGHVERKHVLETCEQFQWGDRFYGITGKNDVARGR